MTEVSVTEGPVLDASPAVAPGLRGSDTIVIAVFVLAAFVGAGLLFLVQPMVARVLLPAYGGSATVWSTSSLFFQVMLLVGYLYTHYATGFLSRHLQRRFHVLVLLLPLLVLPLALPSDAAPAADVSPVIWLLRTLALLIALPFFVVATTGPLVQAWYSWSGRPRAHDPYFLFAASNLGSFVGLLGYPFLIEPFLTVAQQLDLWSVAFVAFAVLVLVCSFLPTRDAGPPEPARTGAESVTARPRVGPRRTLTWLGWSFLPSGLMLSATAHISTDIAAIPLLWVVPLAIYLATFVAAFARNSREVPFGAVRSAAVLALLAAVAGFVPGVMPVGAAVALQLLTLAAVAYAAHARLAATRPEAQLLTRFYLVVAVGGALGGLLNGVVAPVLLDRVLEHHLLLAAVPFLLLGSRGGGSTDTARTETGRRRIVLLVLALLVLVPAMVAAVAGVELGRPVLAGALGVGVAAVGVVLLRFPWVFVGVLLLVQVAVLVAGSTSVIERRRTFYGSYEVSAADDVHRLTHGTTLHGLQFLDERRDMPTTYYARSGPLGDVFSADGLDAVAVVGLGVGTVAAYGEAGQDYTFFEIDGDIVDLARDERFFTYLDDSPARVETVVGDGRLRLEESPDASYDLIVLDAFSSDSIPVHLLTGEAFEMYADKLAPGGRLVVHISNRVFDLEPVARAAANRLDWAATVSEFGGNDTPGVTGSTWVLLAATEDDLGVPADDSWRELAGGEVAWTDDYSSVLSVLK